MDSAGNRTLAPAGQLLALVALARYKEAVSDPLWLTLRKEIALVQMRITELLDSLGSANGNTDKIWREIGSLLDRKQRLADSERRLLYEMKQTVTIEQLMLFMSAFAAAVEKHVADPQVRGAIQIEFDKLARRADPTALDPVQHPR